MTARDATAYQMGVGVPPGRQPRFGLGVGPTPQSRHGRAGQPTIWTGGVSLLAGSGRWLRRSRNPARRARPARDFVKWMAPVRCGTAFSLVYPSRESSPVLLGRAGDESSRFLILPHKLQDAKKIDLFDCVTVEAIVVLTSQRCYHTAVTTLPVFTALRSADASHKQ